MNQKRAGRLGLLTAVAAMVLVNCVDNDKSLVIVHNVAPNDQCEYEIDYEEIIGVGLVDLSFAVPQYWVHIQVHNYMPTNLSIPNRELDAMSVQLEKATLVYEWLLGLELISDQALLDLAGTTFTLYISGLIPAADSSGDPGQMLIGFGIVPADLAAAVAALGNTALYLELGVHIQLHGSTLGQTSISSNDFVFPIVFCFGCLEPATCSDGSTATSCTPGQDYSPTCAQ